MRKRTAARRRRSPEEKAWTLQMTPEVYLKLHPDGQHAALARERLDEPKDETPTPEAR